MEDSVNQLRLDGTTAVPRATPVKDTALGKRVSAIIASVALALAGKKLPALDAGGANILAAQVRNLLKAGYPDAEVGRNAIALALKWHRRLGHKQLLQLQATMQEDDDARREAEHAAQKDGDTLTAQEIALNLHDQGIEVPGIEKLLGERERKQRMLRHPNHHDFISDPADPLSCSTCHGPLGVHVRRLAEEKFVRRWPS